MLVYGDAECEKQPSDLCLSIAEKLIACMRMRPGCPRHSALVRAFIQAGELVQGLADREFEAKGADDLSPMQQSGARLLKALATAVDVSWHNMFDGHLPLTDDWPAMLGELDTQGPIRTRQAEGYAFYALYPEAYLAAARASALRPDTVVIGLRSIGTGLAALVTAAIDAKPAFTLRPVGHPFDRRIAATPALTAKILENPDAHYAVVDEGPGLSGSSFGSVVDWLQDHGVAAGRIHIFPSHNGQPGPQASERHRRHWQGSDRHCTDMDALILDTHEPAHRLRNWVSALVGEEIEDWKDISGGAWRDLGTHSSGGCRPPADMQNEKRKFLASSANRRWLVKFTGLGEDAVRKVHKASLLSEAGFIPKVAGMRYGFLVGQWLEGTRLSEVTIDRTRLVAAIARYFGFRARRLPASGNGASLRDLGRMAAVNTGELLGTVAAAKVEGTIATAENFAALLRPIDTDNRLHAWEWIVTEEGNILKADALDHSSAHDPIGCQDLAWDIAGAATEFDLTPAEREALQQSVADAAGYETRPDLIALFEIFYLTFQAGLWTNASASLTGDEAARCAGLVRRYADRLASLLDHK
jgi:hypothetical protein